ncbi:putative RNA uridine N3 methyltransferase [Sulfolobus tengchongensis]|uniref:RNA uridine N3 methyltransferase n=1 Tax=Sulfolobus tengchongensis TaxID=207809 RepID=A0AAX4L4D1_9CREN
MMFPFSRYKPLNVVLFMSTFDIENTLLEITLKLSFILRVTNTFRVNKIYWIKDSPKSERIAKIITEITRYTLSPPYLKKYIPYSKNLKKVGIMEPVTLPSHLIFRQITEGEIRIGHKGDFGINTKLNPDLKAILITDSLKLDYVPYNNLYYNGVKNEFIEFKNIFNFENLIIASRSGKNPLKNMEEIVNLYKRSGLTLVIGQPTGNLLHNLGKQYLEKSYNFVIKQGVSDVRVEEALAYSLSILNLLLS